MGAPSDHHVWTALRAATVAAEALGERFTAHEEVEHATRADVVAEDRIVRIITERFPEHNVISEESAAEFATRPRWVVDPLDGTTNFHNGVPHFSVSVAFEGTTHPDLGVVYYVPSDQVFVGIEGAGAFINGQPAVPSSTDQLADAFVATGFAAVLAADVDTSYVEALVRSTQGVRRAGSAATELAMVASGQFDVYVEYQLDVWDTTAGILLVEEAGGEVTRIEAIDGVTGEIVVASNSHLHDEFINFIISQGPLG